MHFMSKFDVLISAKQFVAAESLFNSHRRRGLEIDVSRYNSLMRGWAEQVRSAIDNNLP